MDTNKSNNYYHQLHTPNLIVLFTNISATSTQRNACEFYWKLIKGSELMIL